MRGGSERAELIARLRGAMDAYSPFANAPDRSVIRTGWPALDRALPFQGLRRGSLIELLDGRSGCGAETVAAAMIRSACRFPGTVVVVDGDGQFYPPALAAWGVDLAARMAVVHPDDAAGAMWSAGQALRSRAVAAVWFRCGRLTPHDSRRLQLAAEEGGTLGVLFRPSQARGQPTWADVQLAVEPRPSARGRRLRLEITRCRGRVAGAVDIEIGDVCEGGHHETTAVPTPAELVGPAAAC